MKTKRIIAAVLSMRIIGGAMPVMGAFAEETTKIVDTEKEVPHLDFDAETGVLTLHGQLAVDEVKKFSSAPKVKEVYAADDT
ncbi:hypothetical protein, partial [Ruminococcus flavefaciens]|uniref:hypothetical protein n=1 Tax=Ruminococcus flavefaciens TaxID=1265 RepID=UPI0026EBB274